MPTTQYKKNPNEDTAYFDGHKVNLIAVPAGTLQLPIHPTSDSGYVVDNDGKKHRVLMATFLSGTIDYKDSKTADSAYMTVNGQKVKVRLAVKENGTLTLSDKPNVDQGYVVGDDSEKHRVTLINTPTGTLELPNNETDDSAYIIDGDGNKIKVRMFALLAGGYVEVTVSGVSPLSLPDAVAADIPSLIAFGGTEQRNLPSGYTQVNYVTNTAQTAVDTGIMIDFAKNYEFEVECRAVSGSWYILQSRASASGNITGIHGETSGSTIKLVVGNVTVCTSAITRTVGNKLYVKATLNAGTATLYVKDETANTEDTQTGSYGTSQPNPTASVYLLGNAGGQYVDVNSDIYMARIKENDTVVMDYVPARQVATAGFYDTVSGTFKTALTPANLSADGNTVPTPDAPMDIVSNNGVLKARHQSGLPLGYTLLDYIESSGTQYIDTGVVSSSNVGIDVVVQYTDLSGTNEQYSFGLGGLTSGLRFALGKTSAQNFLGYNTLATNISGLSFVENTTYNIKLGLINNVREANVNSTFVVDLSSYNNWTDTRTIPLFCRKTTTEGVPVDYAKIKMYSAKIYSNNTLVRDMIPARRESDGVLGMYDLANGQFYTNAGTGTFTAGTTVSDPVEIYTDGTVETINVHTKNLFDKTTVTANRYINSSGVVTGDGTNKTVVSDKIYVKPNTTYTLSGIGDIEGATYYRSGYQYKADNTPISAIASTSGTPVTFTTDAECAYVRVMSVTGNVDTAQLEQGSTSTSYVPYFNGGTATCEDLLSVGNYTDEQEMISGAVTRKVGIKVLDGTENWQSVVTGKFYIIDNQMKAQDNSLTLCSHYKSIKASSTAAVNNGQIALFVGGGARLVIADDNYTNTAAFQQFLAEQYAAGTPVIVVYPLATPTTESVTGQTMQVQQGDNIVEITQASLNNLELQVTYMKEG